jgi:hypothetical protein
MAGAVDWDVTRVEVAATAAPVRTVRRSNSFIRFLPLHSLRATMVQQSNTARMPLFQMCGSQFREQKKGCIDLAMQPPAGAGKTN